MSTKEETSAVVAEERNEKEVVVKTETKKSTGCKHTGVPVNNSHSVTFRLGTTKDGNAEALFEKQCPDCGDWVEVKVALHGKWKKSKIQDGESL